VGEVDEFLAATLSCLEEADTALHNGNPELRIATWSQQDPVTLFGAVISGSGWDQIRPTFERLGSTFSQCESFRYEVLAAGASGDLGYIEHTTASIAGAPPAPYKLRVTTILRREDGEWKVVHRHADALPDDDSTGDQVARLETERDAP